MNYGRLVAAAVAALVADIVYGFLVYGTLMASEFAKYPAVYRGPEGGTAHLPLMFAGIFLALFPLVAIYAKGYEGGSGLSEGARFGLLLGAFGALFIGSENYGVLILNKKISVMLVAARFVELLIVGIVIGLVYKGTPKAAR